MSISRFFMVTPLLAVLAGSSLAQSGSGPKPWKAGVGAFTLTDKAGLSVQTGLSLEVGYSPTAPERASRGEDFITGFYRRFRASDMFGSETFTAIGAMYERTFSSPNQPGYLGAGLGFVNLSGAGFSETDFAFDVFAGVYFTPDRRFGAELKYIDGGRPGNTHIGLSVFGRF